MVVVERFFPVCNVLPPYRLLCCVRPLPLKISAKGEIPPTLRTTDLQ